MPKCLTCGAELTERTDAKSKRADETLFICKGGTPHKNQGHFDGKFWHISQSGPKNVLVKSAQVNVREYPHVLAAIKAAGFGPQDVWQAGKLALDIRAIIN